MPLAKLVPNLQAEHRLRRRSHEISTVALGEGSTRIRHQDAAMNVEAESDLERLAPLSVPGYQRMVARAGAAARFPFLIHSHMLRHSCGYKLANDGHDTRAIQHYLGHRSIASTVRYTALAPYRFKGFWKD